MLSLVALSALLAGQPAAPPAWSTLPPRVRGAIQSHLDDMFILPHGEVADVWALRERHRVLKRCTRPTTSVRVSNRESRAWALAGDRHSDASIPTITEGVHGLYDAYLDDDRVMMLLGSPFPSTQFEPEFQHYGLGPSCWAELGTNHIGTFELPEWSIDTRSPRFTEWVGDAAWALVWVPDTSILIAHGLHQGDNVYRVRECSVIPLEPEYDWLLAGQFGTPVPFGVLDRMIEIPRGLRSGYLWISHLYDPNCIGRVMPERAVKATRDGVVEAIAAGDFTLTTWKIVERAGVETWEVDAVVDAAALITQP